MTSFAFWEPIIVICLINVIFVTGLYINALSGILQLCTAALAGIGGYSSAVLTTNFGWPFIPSIVVGAFAGAVIGTLLAIVTARMAVFILKLVTLAFGEMAVIFAFNLDYIGGANSFAGIPLETGLLVASIGAALAVYIAWQIDRSPSGNAARCVRDDPVAAEAIGISVLKIRILTFAIGAALIGMGGAIQAHYLLIINPTELGFFVSLTYIIFLVVGGIQTLWGPILIAVVLTALPEALRFASEYRLVLYGFVIVLIVLMRPEGLITRKSLRRSSYESHG
ncbi:MAG: branched-chain amino acid transport system permease protein [Woeseiaceae bacterium]